MKLNIRKSVAILGILTVGATALSGCGETTATAQEAPAQATGQEAAAQGDQKGGQQGGATGEGMQARGTMIVGRVSKILGNEVTIDLAEAMETGGMMQNRGEGEGMAADGGQVGGRGEAGGEVSEDMMAQRQEAMASGGGGMSAGGGRSEAGMTAGTGGGGMATGCGMASAGTTTDMADSITLTGVEETYSIPVGTAVMQYGTEMSFTQITEKMYISLSVDDENNVLSVNILG
ncbi:MAG: hypothetical protein R3Y53_04005 [Bacillota bacterium]